MTIRQNGYNNASLGQAFENIAGLFAPMSGADLSGYAAADANRQKAAAEAQRIGLIDMFAGGQGPMDDRIGIAAGLYNPAQSWGAVQMGDQTTRRGQDLDLQGAMYTSDNSLQGTMYGADKDYAASTENNVRDNTRALQTGAMDNLMAPLKPGEQTRDISIEEWAGMGLPQMPATEEYINATPDPSATKLTNVKLPDGRVTVAQQTPQGLIDPQTRQPIPAGTTMFSTAAQGPAEDVGLGTTNKNRVDAQAMAAVSALDTINELETLITQNPASQGVMGVVRGTAQDVVQTGSEIGRFFGGTMAEVADAAAAGLIDANVASEMYDESIPAIDMLMNVLAWQYAKSFAGDRVSNEQLKMARNAVGSTGSFNNQANSTARLSQLRDMFGRDLSRLGGILSPEIQQMAAPYLNGAPPAPAAPAGGEPPVGTIEDGFRYIGGGAADPNNWEAVQ